MLELPPEAIVRARVGSIGLNGLDRARYAVAELGDLGEDEREGQAGYEIRRGGSVCG